MKHIKLFENLNESVALIDKLKESFITVLKTNASITLDKIADVEIIHPEGDMQDVFMVVTMSHGPKLKIEISVVPE